MFYHWLYPLSQNIRFFNIFKYISFRSFLAFILSFFFSVVIGKFFIQYIRRKQFGQVIRAVGPETHLKKAGTPTFGGVFIMISVGLSLLFNGNFLSGPLLITLVIFLSYFALGWLDDYLKVLKKNPKGVSARMKLCWQFLTAILILSLALRLGVIDSKLYLPLIKGAVIDLGWCYVLWGSLVIVGSSNAVNLTDGLDGLAIGPIIISIATLGLLSYLSGHSELAAYLFLPYVENSGELLIFAASIIGAGVGFLWYNSHPAQIFMGDSGSLPLGGALGVISVLTKNELLFVLIGGIFVIEAVSVILQVASFKLRGKRIFKMAPLHHHFELLGYAETKVTVRFWIISLVLALLALATIKTR